MSENKTIVDSKDIDSPEYNLEFDSKCLVDFKNRILSLALPDKTAGNIDNVEYYTILEAIDSRYNNIFIENPKKDSHFYYVREIRTYKGENHISNEFTLRLQGSFTDTHDIRVKIKKLEPDFYSNVYEKFIDKYELNLLKSMIAHRVEECNIKDDDVVHCDDIDDKKKIVVGTIDLKESLDSERKLYVSQYSFEQYVYTYKDSLGRWNICINPKFIARHSFCRAFVLSEVVNLFHSLENLIDVLNNEDEYALTEEQKDFIKNNTW